MRKFFFYNKADNKEKKFNRKKKNCYKEEKGDGDKDAENTLENSYIIHRNMNQFEFLYTYDLGTGLFQL